MGGTVGVYDYDFMQYRNVIPNLECAKLVTYYRAHNRIAVLAPAMEPAKYTDFVIRKEYDDGVFPRQCFLPNVTYGGRAFNPAQYQPLAPAIEATIPDMHLYDRYIDHFGTKNAELTQIKRILNCTHMRLAPDSQTLPTFDTFKDYFYKGINGIFLHDYDLAGLKAYDLIMELQNQRHFVTKYGINPYPVGNKYPIMIYSSEELEKWLKVVTIPNAFFLQYNGLMTDEVLYHLCIENRRMARQVYYNVTHGCSSENEFFMYRLPKIFVQTLFLRRSGIKLLLNYDDGFFKTPELEKFIELLNCWLSFQWMDGFTPITQTLYMLCLHNRYLHYTSWAYLTITVSVDDCRNIFQFFREKNYPLFQMFYEWDAVTYKGGKFINDWTGNSLEN